MAWKKHQLAWSLRDQHELKMNRAMRFRNKSKKNGKAEKKWDDEALKFWSLLKEAEPPLAKAGKEMFAAHATVVSLKPAANVARLELGMAKLKECICIIKFVCLQVGPLQASSDLHISDWSISKWRKESHEVKALAILKEVKKEGRRSNQKVSQEFMQRVKEAFTASVHST